MRGSFRSWRHGVLSLLFLAVSPLLRGDDAEPAVIRDFSKGLQTTLDSSLIDDGASPDLLNVDVENGSIEKKGGSVAVSTSSLGGYNLPVRLLDEYVTPAGVRWEISASSATLFKSSNGGQDNNILTSTHGFTMSSQYCSVTAFGKFRLTDGNANWLTFDGSVVGTSTSAPHGATCAFFGDRVWTSIGSTLYGSDVNNVENWTVDTSTSSTDATAIEQYVRREDGQGITCLKPFKDRLLVFKAQSLDAYVQNDDGLSYTLTQISNHIGTTQCNTVSEREGDVVFLGPDAVYKYDPGTEAYKGYAGSVKKITDAIRPTADAIQQLDVNSAYWSDADTLTQDFELFSSSSNVEITDGKLYLAKNHTNVADPDFYFPASYNDPYWSVSSVLGAPYYYGVCPATIDPVNTVCARVYAGTHDTDRLEYSIYDPSLSTLISSGSVVASSLDSVYSVSLPVPAAGRWVKLRLRGIDSATGIAQSTMTSVSSFLTSGDPITFKARRTSVGYIFVDQIYGGRSTIYSGSFVSRSFNTGASSPAWNPSSISYALNGNAVSFQTQSSSDGSTWDSPVAWTPGAAPASASKEYIRYLVSLSTGGTTNGTARPYVDDVYLSANLSSVSYGPAWGEYHLGSYVLSVATGTGTNSLLIYDRNSAWTAYDDSWYCMKRLASGIILGGGQDGKIYRFRDKNIPDANGSAISWHWRSKDYDFGLPVTDKVMLRYYVTADRVTGSEATFEYGVDRGAPASKTLDLDLYPGFFHEVIRPASTTYSKGIQHYFRLSGSGVGQNCTIRSVTMRPRSETNP